MPFSSFLQADQQRLQLKKLLPPPTLNRVFASLTSMNARDKQRPKQLVDNTLWSMEITEVADNSGEGWGDIKEYWDDTHLFALVSAREKYEENKIAQAASKRMLFKVANRQGRKKKPHHLRCVWHSWRVLGSETKHEGYDKNFY
ncbi:hypothetical protein M9H77_12148 [Catharanthus roseus]|uniref:Uncharacterized protein n=1 Tax=Catharanthus roseus TaxID=4058 RepID=A0ACC0BGN8_CATRO|nr:hypothetical protein M9H77_12148 [Catharanthus roseus]